MEMDGTKDRLQIQNEIGEVASSNLEKVRGEGALIGRGVSCDVIKYKLKSDLGPLNKGSFVAVKRFRRSYDHWNEMYNLWKLKNVDSVIRFCPKNISHFAFIICFTKTKL